MYRAKVFNNDRYHTHPKFLPFPAKHIALRGTQEEKYVVVDVTKGGCHAKIIEVEVSRALFEIYEGGVVGTLHLGEAKGSHFHFQFIHQGLTFIVSFIDSTFVHRLSRLSVDERS